MPANYSITTRSDGETLTAAKYNADHQNHIDKGTPTYHDDYSENLSQMRSQVDPGETGAESLPTTLAGELERIRYRLNEIAGMTYWYQTGTGIRAQSSTYASLPTAGTSGRLGYRSDTSPGLYVDTGSAWVRVTDYQPVSVTQVSTAGGGTVTPNAATYMHWAWTVTSGTTLTIGAPTTPLAGQELILSIMNSAGAAIVVSWNSIFANLRTLYLTNSTQQTVRVVYDATRVKWIPQGNVAQNVYTLQLASSTPGLGAISANTTTSFNITVAGAAVGDDCTANPNGSIGAEFVWSAYVSATDTVTVVVANVTTGSATPTSRTWYTRVTKV